MKLIDIEAASKKFRFNNKVFLLEPWREIYQTDNERKMDFDQVTQFHLQLIQAYEENGYNLIPVPQLSIEDRAQFIKEQIF